MNQKKKASKILITAFQAPGLSLLPISLIKGRQGIDAQNEDVENRLIANKERQRVIRSKHHSGKNLPHKDQRELEELEDLER